MGLFKCRIHGDQSGSLTSPKIGDALIGRSEIQPTEIKSVFLTFNKNEKQKDMKKIILDVEFLEKFGLKREDTILIINDQDERHIEIADEIRLVCSVCFNEFLGKNGFKRG